MTVTHTTRPAPGRLGQMARRLLAMLRLSGRRFIQIDGSQWAGAFAFNAFFSLFPLLVLLVTVASFFVDRDRAGNEFVAYLDSHVPMSGPMQRNILDTIAGVITTRQQAGAVAVLILVWSALSGFTTLICAVNRAWCIVGYSWWRLPLKSLMLLGCMAGAVLLGLALSVVMRMTKGWLLPVRDFGSWMYGLGDFLFPSLVVFLGLCLFYRLAPRRPTRFAEVWAAALCATVLLRAGEKLFVIYLTDFATVNAVYGVFGGIMAVLLWIYGTGCIFIFGACLCAARAETLGHSAVNPSAQVG